MQSSICSEKHFNSFSSLSSLNENKKPSEAINSTVSTIFNQSIFSHSQEPSMYPLFQEIQNLHEKAVTTSIPLDRLGCMQKLLVKIREISSSSLSNDQRYLLTNYICKVAVTQTEHKFKANAFKTYVFAFDFLLKNRQTPDLTVKDREILLEKFSESILICSKKMTAFDQDLLHTIEECVQLVTNGQLDKSKEIIQSFLEKNKRKLNTCVIETNKKPRLENNYPVNIYSSQDINLNDLHAIEKHVDQLKQERKLTFDDYQEASDYFNFSKQLLVNKILLDNFSQLDSLAKLNSLELLVQMVHPFPTSAKIRASELEILDRIRLTCKELLTTPYKLQAKNIETKINSLQIDLEFNYTYFMSLKINEKMNALIYCYSLEVETEENAKLDYQTVVQMVKQDINLFETFKTNCQKFSERSKEKACIQQLTSKYKKLATYLIDVAKFLPSEEKPKVLTQAIEFYELVKSYRVSKLEKINLNIIVSRYELASYLKKSGTREAYLKELNTIRSHLHRDLSPRKFYVSYPGVIFYELSLLAAIYAETQDESTRQEALKELEFFANIYQKANLAKSQTLDIINWLQNFSTIFQSKNPLTFSNLPIYSLPSLLNPYWRQERQQQFLNGLDQLISHDFSKNYAINLKSHQIEAMKKCTELLLANKRKGYFCLPTGAGKTYLMLMISLAVKMPTLIMVPTHTLIEQTIQNIQKLDPTIQVSRFDGLVKQQFFGQVLVTTYNSLQNDFKSENPKISLKSFGLVWADEAHHCLTVDRAAIIQTLEETAYVFGLTATDCYNTKRQKKALSHVKDVFGDKIFEIELEHLIESSQLSPVKNIIVHAPNFPSHAKKLKKNKNTDYTDAELAELINVEKFNTIVCDLYFNEYDPYTKQKIFGQSALVFCAGIDHSEAVCALLNAQVGSRWKSSFPLAACVHSKIPTYKRTELVKRHKNGEIPILVGDSVFAEGYDNPKDRIGFFLRPTKSLVFAKQSRGRLLRTAENKENALIFDWFYPGLDQILFKNLVKEQAWIGIEPPKTTPIQRLTTNYSVEWHPSHSSLNQEKIIPLSPLFASTQPLNQLNSYSSLPSTNPFKESKPIDSNEDASILELESFLMNEQQTESLGSFGLDLTNPLIDEGFFAMNTT